MANIVDIHANYDAWLLGFQPNTRVECGSNTDLGPTQLGQSVKHVWPCQTRKRPKMDLVTMFSSIGAISGSTKEVIGGA